MGLKNRLLQTTMRLVRAEESQTRHLSLATKQLYLTYHPDSHSLFSAHPEFNRLLDKFTAHNRANNGGDIVRLWSFILNLKQVLGEGIEGHFAELGVWRGNTAAILAYYARENKRKVYLFDTYEGFSQEDLVGVDAGKTLEFSNTSLDMVKIVVGPEDDFCHYIRGRFPNSIRDTDKNQKFAVVSLDCDLYEPMRAGLEFFYPRMARGGIFFLHDYSSIHWEGAKKAIDEFCHENKEFIILLPDKSGSAFLRKTKANS